jgi:hypothetical protein
MSSRIQVRTKCRLTEKTHCLVSLSFSSNLSIGKTTYLLTVQKQEDGEFCRIEGISRTLGLDDSTTKWGYQNHVLGACGASSCVYDRRSFEAGIF